MLRGQLKQPFKVIAMGKITELTITKGRTVRAPAGEEWLRLEYSLKILVEDDSEIQVAKAGIEGLIDGWLSSSLPASSVKPPVQGKPKIVETIENAFPPELKQLLTFEHNGEVIIIRPRGFLGSENFAKIAEIVKAHNGEYVSAGKSSHFRVPIR
jgi:hypothetical protein